MKRGCDISGVAQGQVDFDALRPQVDFVIAKATEGVGFKDVQFDRSWSEAKRVGLTRGCYHFARPDLGNTAADEAAYFLSVVGHLTDSDIVLLDYEVSWDGDVVGWCWTFLRYIQAMTSVVPLIYLNRALVNGYNWSRVVMAGYPLALAMYPSDPVSVPATPWPKVTMKQWSNSGQLAGIGTFVDLDSWFVEDPVDNRIPQLAGESVTNMDLVVGQVAEYDCVYNYPDHGGDRHIVGKVIGYTPGVRLVVVYPPADPDADPTLVLDAQPCYFVVATR